MTEESLPELLSSISLSKFIVLVGGIDEATGAFDRNVNRSRKK